MNEATEVIEGMQMVDLDGNPVAFDADAFQAGYASRETRIAKKSS